MSAEFDGLKTSFLGSNEEWAVWGLFLVTEAHIYLLPRRKIYS